MLASQAIGHVALQGCLAPGGPTRAPPSPDPVSAWDVPRAGGAGGSRAGPVAGRIPGDLQRTRRGLAGLPQSRSWELEAKPPRGW